MALGKRDRRAVFLQHNLAHMSSSVGYRTKESNARCRSGEPVVEARVPRGREVTVQELPAAGDLVIVFWDKPWLVAHTQHLVGTRYPYVIQAARRVVVEDALQCTLRASIEHLNDMQKLGNMGKLGCYLLLGQGGDAATGLVDQLGFGAVHVLHETEQGVGPAFGLDGIDGVEPDGVVFEGQALHLGGDLLAAILKGHQMGLADWPSSFELVSTWVVDVAMLKRDVFSVNGVPNFAGKAKKNRSRRHGADCGRMMVKWEEDPGTVEEEWVGDAGDW
ncbi:hypothetical protein PG996_016045 [Apiospora saccharicola]|uniref:Uncharacterized protein n=1 Tax=Apiospora saccharicola TaxID=335842 RepID=A0ABR1TMT2_9PEZI